MNLRDRIWRILKHNNSSSLYWISHELGITYPTLRKELENMAPYVVVKNDVVRIKIVLDEIPEVIPLFWRWKPIAEALPIPLAWQNLIKDDVAPRGQGDRGTCVGQDGANTADILYIELTGDLPLADDKSKYKKDVKDDSGVIHDVLYKQSHSAEGIYQDSRRIGNVTAPSGSYTSAAAKALKQIGIGWEDQWLTSKTSYAVWSKLSDDKAKTYYDEAALHKIDGYAQLLTWNDICAAIYKYGVVMSSWVVYENYSNMEGGDGTFLEPRGDEIGSHSLCLIGYDQNYLYCIHSWGDWCGRFGKISKRYYDSGFLDAYTVLDAADTKRIMNEHITVTLQCNVRANWYVNNIFVGITPDTVVKASVQKGTTFIIRCEATDFNAKISEVHIADKDQLISISLAPPSTKSLFQMFLDWLVSWLHGG